MRRTLMTLTATLLLTGCILPEPHEARNDPAAQRATEREDAPCRPFERTLLEWMSAAENPVERTFEVPESAWELDVEWTPPPAATRAYEALIRDPDGVKVFAREQGDGASVGPAAVTLEGASALDDVRTPPKDGTYVFQFVTEGNAVGASLRVVASGCA